MIGLPGGLSDWLQDRASAMPCAGIGVAVRSDHEGVALSTGKSSLTFQQPVRNRTLFNIGSLTKHMVALAILELAREGRLSLADPLGTYLVEARTSNWEAVTLHHLLAHLSGIPDCHQHFQWDQVNSSRVIAASLLRRRLDFLPGQAWAYSNSNYLLLGMVVEIVTGWRFRDVLDQRVFSATGLPHARTDSTWSIVPDRAEPYDTVMGKFVHAPRLHSTVATLGGFGALFSNHDFLAWSKALIHGSRATDHKDCLVPVVLDDGMQLPYGLGWYLGVMRGRLFAWHMGAPPGFRTIHLHLPEEKIAVSVSSNTSVDKMILKQFAFELLEQVLPHSTFLSIGLTEEAPECERRALVALLEHKGQAPPPGILTEGMQHTWICSPGSKPMAKMSLDRCWLIEEHSFGKGRIKNYAAEAAGMMHHFSVVWTKDMKIAAVSM